MVADGWSSEWEEYEITTMDEHVPWYMELDGIMDEIFWTIAPSVVQDKVR